MIHFLHCKHIWEFVNLIHICVSVHVCTSFFRSLPICTSHFELSFDAIFSLWFSLCSIPFTPFSICSISSVISASFHLCFLYYSHSHNSHLLSHQFLLLSVSIST